MKIVFITPASWLRRQRFYRLGGSFYGHTNAITGPLILGHILKTAGHQVEVYEELYTTLNYKRLTKGVDVFCLNAMTSTAPRAYELADRFRRETGARVILGGIHPSTLPEEAAEHAAAFVSAHCDRTLFEHTESVDTVTAIKRLNVEARREEGRFV